MMNYLGKTLVVVHVFLAMLALATAAVLFFLAPDWGMQQPQPRRAETERVASELDKRIAAVNQAVAVRDTALQPVKRAQDDLIAAMDRFYVNHLHYRARLDELREGAGPRPAPDARDVGGALELLPPRIGVPVDQDVPGIDKSRAAYRRELTDKEEGLYKKLADLTEEVRTWVAKNNEVTAHLQGLNPATNKKDRLGLYDLFDHELQMQHRIRAEKAYLQPQWADALEQAASYESVRERLEQTLEGFKAAKDPGKSK
jgi:hypothetical protein